jgi:hypothetical protein
MMTLLSAFSSPAHLTVCAHQHNSRPSAMPYLLSSSLAQVRRRSAPLQVFWFQKTPHEMRAAVLSVRACSRTRSYYEPDAVAHTRGMS